jgi:cysteinyl-tRNA synthetase
MAADPVFRLYNTLTRQVEPLDLLEPGHLRYYACGPTVYSYAHIGNFRAFLTADLIVRTAQALGWKTTFVMNITDVGHLTEDDYADAGGEDRMEKALRSKEGEAFPNIWDLARYYTDAFVQDWHTLGLREPTVRPRATEHVAQQIEMVQQLVETGHAYETEKGVYFSVASFPAYGRLSGNEQETALEQGVRDLVIDDDKRDARDFALWKKDTRHLMRWYSPWGWGFPGWHIECSAMAALYLGETFDLHSGGEDNKFPHHECEIAQSESLTGRPLARCWVHTRHLQVEGEKMAKRTGNFLRVRDLVLPEREGGRGIDPLALRLTLIAGHYRKPFNFTIAALRDNARHIARFRETRSLIDKALADDAPGPDRVGERLQERYEHLFAALREDLNTPEAIAHLLAGIKLINGLGANLNAASARSALQFFEASNALLGVLPIEAVQEVPDAGAAPDPFAEQVEALLQARQQARKDRDFARADALRHQLTEMGIEVMDTPEGPKWKKTVSP